MLSLVGVRVRAEFVEETRQEVERLGVGVQIAVHEKIAASGIVKGIEHVAPDVRA